MREEIRLVKEGVYWTLYIDEVQCGVGAWADMVETIESLRSYEDAVNYAQECQEAYREVLK